jgi:hypothetical protein
MALFCQVTVASHYFVVMPQTSAKEKLFGSVCYITVALIVSKNEKITSKIVLKVKLINE